MQKVSEIMSYNVATATPQSRLEDVIGALRSVDIGAVPVCDDGHLVGIITEEAIDPDAARGASGTLLVADVMAEAPPCCFADQTSEEVAKLMASHKVRHVPVLDRNMRLQGMVTMADMAQRVAGFSEEIRKEIEDTFGTEQVLTAQSLGHKAATSSADGKF
ncbi:MAG TPA: CBS domain-containing protein [Noviherbaspirillum sp.]|uniref:CBS domain-containing protein n=1 Tax=Noviherbaspirillum sp. TaxID=1926288 RepID=UPI002F93246A